MLNIRSLAFTLLVAKGALAVGSPFGFATGTTGGAGAAQAIPTLAAQLKSWQAPDTAYSQLMTHHNTTIGLKTMSIVTFFSIVPMTLPTPRQGSTTEIGCKPFSCSPNPQMSINPGNGCGSDPTTTITYKNAPRRGIQVKSNKIILGKGTSGWIKGKGLQLSGVSNVIIQNIRISDPNPQFVWGGDAIYIDNSSKVWVDHNYFKSTGRQFIVTGFGAAKQVTISNNYFDGQSTWSTGCDQHHYWALLFAGNGDQITFARNYVYYTAGRGPHAGGMSGYSLTIHMYNNYFNEIAGHALDADTGSKLLLEGNYFKNVKTPSTGNTKGAAFAPTSSSMNSQCSASISRNCVSNTLSGSGSLTNTASNGILSSFTASVVKSAPIMDPASVPSFVLANAGLGKVN